MRFSIEAWAPEYGSSQGGEPDTPETPPDTSVELPPERWRPLLPDVGAASEVLFVDGVRRVDAGIWIEQEDGTHALGLCAVYAAGAVRCGAEAEIVEATVGRGLFTAAPVAEDVVTRHGAYRVRATAGSTPEKLWLGIQQRMGELEGEVASRHNDAELVVVDGPLSHRRHVEGAVGYVKSQHVQYLPDQLASVLGELPAGRRTPLFLTTTSWSRFSWYVRLAVGSSPMAGLVRCEVTADRMVTEAARIADRVTATLPRFSSDPHKDPRAPQNLYPIGGLERVLKSRLGDPALMYRALRMAADSRAATPGTPRQ